MMSTPQNKPRVVVIGIGNLLLKDEGIGVHVIRALEEVDTPINIKLELIDGGTSPDILSLFEGADKLIIVDAVKAQGSPGTIYRIKPDSLAAEEKGEISAHELGLRQSLKIMELTGGKPKEVVLIGVEPKDIVWGMDLSPELKQKIPEITAIILEEIGIN